MKHNFPTRFALTRSVSADFRIHALLTVVFLALICEQIVTLAGHLQVRERLIQKTNGFESKTAPFGNPEKLNRR